MDNITEIETEFYAHKRTSLTREELNHLFEVYDAFIEPHNGLVRLLAYDEKHNILSNNLRQNVLTLIAQIALKMSNYTVPISQAAVSHTTTRF